MSEASLTKSSIVVAADHQTSAEVDGETVILDLEEGVYYGLNPVGAQVWENIQEPTTVVEIVEAVTDEYEVKPDKCLKDVICLLHDLKESGLIEIEK